MEYGLWNFHGGLWTGGNNNLPPSETVSRNYYNTTTNDIETPTFLLTTPVSNETINSFTTSQEIQHNQMNLKTNLEFLTIKSTVPINNRIPSIVVPAHQDEHLQAVSLEGVSITSDLVSEQRSMDGLTLTDSAIPSLINHQPNPANSNDIRCNNNFITNNNNNNNDEDHPHPHPPPPPPPPPPSSSSLSKKGKPKNERRDNEEAWENVNEQEANIKLENSCGVDYLFSQSYQHPMYNTTFSPVASNKREIGTSDETDEEDDESEETVPQGKLIEDLQNNISSVQNRSLGMSSIQNTAIVNFSKNTYECGECGLISETRPGLKKHIATYHSSSPNTDLCLGNTFQKSTFNKCPITSCSFRSSEKDEMETHMARHVSGDYKLNGKKRVGSLTPQRVRYEREEYRCQICAYSCTVEKAFYKHLKIHSIGRQINQVKISCVICGKDRSSEVDMNKHMKKHRDDRYFCCDICIFKTVQLKKLIQHRRMHTGEKPHLCPHCSYRSARRDNLRSHVRRVHKKENLFCDTFSPRGLQLAPTGSTTTTATITPSIPPSNPNHVF